jgi:hypothetical protein
LFILAIFLSWRDQGWKKEEEEELPASMDGDEMYKFEILEN